MPSILCQSSARGGSGIVHGLNVFYQLKRTFRGLIIIGNRWTIPRRHQRRIRPVQNFSKRRTLAGPRQRVCGATVRHISTRLGIRPRLRIYGFRSLRVDSRRRKSPECPAKQDLHDNVTQGADLYTLPCLKIFALMMLLHPGHRVPAREQHHAQGPQTRQPPHQCEGRAQDCRSGTQPRVRPE